MLDNQPLRCRHCGAMASLNVIRCRGCGREKLDRDPVVSAHRLYESLIHGTWPFRSIKRGRLWSDTRPKPKTWESVPESSLPLGMPLPWINIDGGQDWQTKNLDNRKSPHTCRSCGYHFHENPAGFALSSCPWCKPTLCPLCGVRGIAKRFAFCQLCSRKVGVNDFRYLSKVQMRGIVSGELTSWEFEPDLLPEFKTYLEIVDGKEHLRKVADEHNQSPKPEERLNINKPYPLVRLTHHDFYFLTRDPYPDPVDNRRFAEANLARSLSLGRRRYKVFHLPQAARYYKYQEINFDQTWDESDTTLYLAEHVSTTPDTRRPVEDYVVQKDTVAYIVNTVKPHITEAERELLNGYLATGSWREAGQARLVSKQAASNMVRRMRERLAKNNITPENFT